MKKEKKYLGIIDWGIGGTSVYQLIKERRPNTPVIYFSDTGVTPYGKMKRRELLKRLHEVTDELVKRGVTHLVIGCNAASTALDEMHRDDVKILGIIEPAVRLVKKQRSKSIALIGGKRTVKSAVHARKMKNVKVRGRVAQPLSALIEAGDLYSEQVHETCRKILSPLKNEKQILLACTHYPAVLPVLKKYVKPSVQWLDPAQELVAELLRMKNLPAGSGDIFLTSGDPAAMKSSARKAFGVRISSAKKIRIPHP